MNKQRVLLITPPYHAGVVESAGRWPPLGLLYLAGSLTAGGHDAEVYDAMTKTDDLETIKRHIASQRPDVVATGAYTSSFYAARDVLHVAKEVNPAIITIIGGVHPTFMYEEAIEGGGIDFVVRGEGERTLRELVDALGDTDDVYENGRLRKIRGIAYQEDGQLVVTPPRPFAHNLDLLPSPAWELVDWDDYTLYPIPGSKLACVSSSRGCTNECGFCSQQKFWNQTHRMRSPENFLAEIDLLHQEYSVDVFLITDEYPTRDRERWEAILDGLIARNYDARFLMETCVADIVRDADIMHRYREAGVLHIYVGVEATKQERLDLFKKDIRCEQSREALRLIRGAGMISECSFILGVPEETKETVADSLELADHYDPDNAHFLLLAPWPYADMYEDLKPHIEEYDYSRYNLVEPVIKPEAMSRDEIMQETIDAYRRFYSRKLGEWLDMPQSFRRDYLLRAMKEMLDRSFLKNYSHGLGEIPAEIEKNLERLEECQSV
jgi:anaerobic magnesium-protoporphyrin IX monomethyl ester cyclase